MEVRKPTTEEFELVKKAAKSMVLDLSNATKEQFVCAFSSCGLAGFVRVNVQGEINELATLGVIKEFRKQGVSTMLIKFLQQNNESLYITTIIQDYFSRFEFLAQKEVPKPLQSKFTNAALWHGFGDPVVMKWEKGLEDGVKN